MCKLMRQAVIQTEIHHVMIKQLFNAVESNRNLSFGHNEGLWTALGPGRLGHNVLVVQALA